MLSKEIVGVYCKGHVKHKYVLLAKCRVYVKAGVTSVPQTLMVAVVDYIN